MISCTFFRINNNVYNANCIKQIYVADDAGPKYKCHEFVKIIIYFIDEMDKSPLHGYTHWPDIGQILYDWKHNKSNFFEISIFDDLEAERINKKWLDEMP